MQTLIRNALCIACAATVAFGCSNADTATQARSAIPTRVIVEPVEFERTNTRLEAVGTSRALSSAELYPVSSGEVVAVNFEPGQAVAEGDILLELDSREQRLAVELATVRFDDATKLYDRYQRSAKSGAVVPTVLDQAKTTVLTTGIELEQAQVALADRTMRAPFAGFVGVTEVDPGNRINTDTLVTTLDDRSGILVAFDVPEAFVGQLDNGAPVSLEPWSSREPGVEGVIVDIGSRIDPQTRTFIARARVENTDDEFRPGMSFRVTAELAGELYPVINETGLQWGADGAYIWTVVDGQASRIPVQVVQRREGRVLVDGDIDSDAIVVTEGIQRVRDGVAVSFDSRSFANGAGNAPGISQQYESDSD